MRKRWLGYKALGQKRLGPRILKKWTQTVKMNSRKGHQSVKTEVSRTKNENSNAGAAHKN